MRLFLLFTFLVCVLTVQAQSPPGINYQGVARDSDGKAVSQKDISLRISIVKDNSDGVVEYTEVHTVKTNQFGLFTLVIGEGSALTGEFQFISWAVGNKWLRIEMDLDGGNAFKLMGSQQLMSVPYALYAKYAGSTSDAKQDLSLTANKLKVTNNPAATEINLAPYLDNTDSQTLALNAKQLSVSGGNILDVTPFFDNTDAQTLGLNSNKLSITGGNEVDLTPYLDNTDAQSLSLTTSGTTRTVAISGGNSIAIDVADNDNSPTNEIQDLSLNGNTLSLSSDATTVNLLPYLDNTDSQNLGNVLTQGNDAGAQKITNLGTPAANADAATKKYVDDADAVINARISANYAFKATYSYTQGVGPGNDISFSLTPSFDDFGVLGSSTFTAAVTGTYLFILDGSASNVPAPVFSLLSNGTKYPVAMGSNGRYNATFMLKLTAGQTVSLVGDNLGSNYSINGSFYGYKLL